VTNLLDDMHLLDRPEARAPIAFDATETAERMGIIIGPTNYVGDQTVVTVERQGRTIHFNGGTRANPITLSLGDSRLRTLALHYLLEARPDFSWPKSAPRTPPPKAIGSDNVIPLNVPWHAKAREMRDRGCSLQQIADGVAVDRSRVSRLFLTKDVLPQVAPDEFNESHKPRIVRQIIDRSALPRAFRAFAAGEIDRTELLKRIAA
jgi:hypothetical protein